MATIFLVVGMLGSLIVVHEIGHFIAAKFFGVRVEEFGLGYPPRSFSFGKWGGTEYTLNWIPFGGFVRLYGDVGEDKHGSGSFVDKSRGARAIILVAGVFMNAVAAWALFAGALYVGVPRVVTNEDTSAPVSLLVAHVLPGSPAAAAGLVPGDKIVAVQAGGGNGQAIDALTPEGVTEFVQTRPGEAIEISYLRRGTLATTIVRPAHAVIPTETERPAIGVELALVSTEPLPLSVAAKEAFATTGNAFLAVGIGLWSIARDIATGAPAFENIMGPVGLVGTVGAAAEHGIGEVLALAAFISINLVIINLLPIPALDGGRLFLLGIEAVLRRDVSRFALRLLNVLGIACIVLLMVAVTYNDIVRLLT